MIVKKNKKGTYDLTGVSLGKLIAIVHAISMNDNPTAVQTDVKELIRNNPDFKKEGFETW